MSGENKLLKLLLPEYLISHFDIVRFEEKENLLHIYFEEKSTVPKEFSSLHLQSKGFHDEITVDDFPLRGKSVKLHIRRRRWTDVKSGKKLVALSQLMSVGDADVYYHHEEFIFPNDKGGIPDAFMYKMEEMEKDEKNREKKKKASKTYLWDGAAYRLK